MLSSVGSGAYTSASNADKGSHNSSDDLSESESDSMKKVQVAVARGTEHVIKTEHTTERMTS
jgi:hypothetical protein